MKSINICSNFVQKLFVFRETVENATLIANIRRKNSVQGLIALAEVAT